MLKFSKSLAVSLTLLLVAEPGVTAIAAFPQPTVDSPSSAAALFAEQAIPGAGREQIHSFSTTAGAQQRHMEATARHTLERPAFELHGQPEHDSSYIESLGLTILLRQEAQRLAPDLLSTFIYWVAKINEGLSPGDQIRTIYVPANPRVRARIDPERPRQIEIYSGAFALGETGVATVAVHETAHRVFETLDPETQGNLQQIADALARDVIAQQVFNESIYYKGEIEADRSSASELFAGGSSVLLFFPGQWMDLLSRLDVDRREKARAVARIVINVYEHRGLGYLFSPALKAFVNPPSDETTIKASSLQRARAIGRQGIDWLVRRFLHLRLLAAFVMVGALAGVMGQVPSTSVFLAQNPQATSSMRVSDRMASLRDPRNIDQIGAIVSDLLNSGRAGQEALARFIASPRENSTLRELALEMLRPAQNVMLTNAVIALLNDPALGDAALAGLNSLRDPRGIPALTQALSAGRARAAIGLGLFENPSAERALESALRNSTQPNVRAEAASALGRRPSAAAALIRALGDPDHRVSDVAMQSLNRLRQREVGDAVLTALRTETNDRALNQLVKLAGLRRDVRAVSLLLHHLTASPVSAEYIAVALSQIGDTRTILAPLLRETHHADYARRMRALLVLSYVGGPGVEDRLLQMMTEDEDNIVQMQAMIALGKMRSVRAAPAIVKRLSLPGNMSDRSETFDALASIGTREAVWGIARAAYLSPEYGFRHAAVERLRRIVADHGPANITRVESERETRVFNYLRSIGANSPEEKRILLLYERSLRVGIEYPFRLEAKVLEHVLDVRAHLDVRSAKPLVVVIFPKKDHNDAFYQSHFLTELMEAGFRIALFEASTDREVAQQMLLATRVQKARIIIPGAHSDQNAMGYGTADPRLYAGQRGPFTLDIDDEDWLRAMNVGDSLEPGGQIIFEACSVGAGRRGASNVMNMFRRLFRNASAIWGPTVPSAITAIELDSNLRVKRVYYGGERDPYIAHQTPATPGLRINSLYASFWDDLRWDRNSFKFMRGIRSRGERRLRRAA